MTFQKEADFEEALIKVLADKGWEKEVIKNPTEQDLIRNWAKILYDNKPSKTSSEIGQRSCMITIVELTA